MKLVATSLGPVFTFPSNSCNHNQTDPQGAWTATDDQSSSVASLLKSPRPDFGTLAMIDCILVKHISW